ncbi:ABC transporter ATP-binding protein [Paracoccus ravus]|uniref:ABC transporter ATP-binding protein n=1 Tax=Paracoccus ravus TaxID=2447760 RepID=UPI00106E70D2|nr:ABC transporter ATP-binding protein [Paracoccus ravus]
MTVEHHLVAEALSAGYHERIVVKELDLAIPAGRITAIVGANACGKSTLLRSLSRLLPPRSGQRLLDGRAIHRIPSRELSRMLGLLPQAPIAPEGITVAELVSRGRHPHHRLMSRWSPGDDAAVAEALEATHIAELADRPVDELSGGQRQRVWIALALAQQTDLLLLDEPTTFLDVCHQAEMLDLLADLNRKRGTTVVMVLHDLNLAARYSDCLVAMRAGQLYKMGSPDEILTVDTVRAVFGLESRIIPDPVSGKPIMLPIGRHHITTDGPAG